MHKRIFDYIQRAVRDGNFGFVTLFKILAVSSMSSEFANSVSKYVN